MFGRMSGMVTNQCMITLHIEVGKKKSKVRWRNNNDSDIVHNKREKKLKPPCRFQDLVAVRVQLG